MGSIGLEAQQIPNIVDFDVCPHLGFATSDGACMPALNPYYKPWNDLLRRLSSLLASRQLRREVQALPLLRCDQLEHIAERRRAYLLLASLTQAYVFEDPDDPVDLIPPSLAVPFLEVCSYWGREPILSHIGYCLWNWTIRDDLVSSTNKSFNDSYKRREVLLQSLDNVQSCSSFTSTVDEKAFSVVPLLIEAEGGPMIATMLKALQDASNGLVESVTTALLFCNQRLDAMAQHLQIIHKQCDPQIFYHQIRPFIAGSRGMEAKGLPNGFVFDLGNGERVPSKRIGATAGQSSLFQFMDIVFGIEHNSTFLVEMRAYMPQKHREFLETVEQLPNLRGFIDAHPAEAGLQHAFDKCIRNLRAWRTNHVGIATRYVVMPARKLASKEGVKGTGGSLPIPFLKETRDETV